jgi:hypothetical protein
MIDQDYYKIKISPQLLQGDIITQTLSGDTFGTYSGLSLVLSGGPGNTSQLVDVSIPIVLNQTTIDIGYYSVFDGSILQKDIVNNFIFSATTTFPNRCYLYNTSDNKFKKFLDQVDFYVDWGDGTPTQFITSYFPTPIQHDYTITPADFTITMSAVTPWGIGIVQKPFSVPFTTITINNPEGNTNFPPTTGNWSGTSSSYNFIYSGDADCDAQTIRPAGTTPVLITGYTNSNLYDMKKYGGGYKTIGIPFTGATGVIGTYLGTSLSGQHTYVINDITYVDNPDGTTIFYFLSSGFTLLDCQYITKDETLMNVIEQPQVNSNVFVERGNNTALEYMNRIGEVDNIGDITKYGYKFFKFQEF